MKSPFYTRNQFIDDVLLNAAAATVSGSFAAFGAALFQPGLVHPEAASWTVNGLIADLTAPLPFGVMFGSGALAFAHGTVTGQDTQSYAVDFSSLVPGTGTITAYMVAEYAQIQQVPVQITGPPPGHPDYTPSFTPFTGFSENVDSLNFIATTTPADNVHTFEIFRTTLTAGATGLGPQLVNFQRRVSPIGGGGGSQTMLQVSGAVTVTPADAGFTYVFNGAGQVTLPLASESNGLSVTVVCATTSAIPIQPQGGDLIFGTALAPGTGQSSVSVSEGAAITIQAQFGVWQITSGTASALGAGSSMPIGTMFIYPGSDLPSGCVYANGQLLSTTEFPALFAKYGYTYGGSGSSFGVPDVRGVVVAGVDNMGAAGIRGLLSDFGNAVTNIGALIGVQNIELTPAHLPSHTHNFSGTTGTENQSHTHNQAGDTALDSNPGGATGAWSGGGQLGFGGTTLAENQSHNHNFSGTTDGGNGTSGAAFDIVQPTGMYPVLIKAA